MAAGQRGGEGGGNGHMIELTCPNKNTGGRGRGFRVSGFVARVRFYLRFSDFSLQGLKHEQ